jgi:hypothetical protein
MKKDSIDLENGATPFASTAYTREEIMAGLRTWLRQLGKAIRSLERLRDARFHTSTVGGFIKGLKREVDQIDESLAVLLYLKASTSKEQLTANKRNRKARPRPVLTRS